MRTCNKIKAIQSSWCLLALVLAAGPPLVRGQDNAAGPPLVRVQDNAAAMRLVRLRVQRETLQHQNAKLMSDAENRMKSVVEVASKEELEAMTRICGLTETQRSKLRLAATGDLMRMMRRIKELREHTSQELLGEEALLKINQELNCLRIMSGHFGDDSLFYKTLRGLLTEDQQPRYRDIERRRQESMVSRALQIVEKAAPATPFSDEQRKQIISMIVTKGDPPTTVTPYSHVVVFLHAEKLRGALMTLMEKSQWSSFEGQMANAHRMEPYLRSSGLLPRNEPSDPVVCGDATMPTDNDVTGKN